MNFRNSFSSENPGAKERVIKIRRVRESDAVAIDALLEQLMPGSAERRRSLWPTLFQTEGYTAWVADTDSELAGFLDLFILPDIAHGGWMGLINNLVVDGRFRGRGLGESLLREAIEHSKSQGVVELHLWTAFGNEPAIGLYEKVGFEKRALLMELEL